jgi:hypothetical protein
VSVGGSALGGQKVVPSVPFVEVRPFRKFQGRADENLPGFSHKPLFGGAVFLQQDAGKLTGQICSAGILAIIPFHIDQPLLPIIIVKKGRIET